MPNCLGCRPLESGTYVIMAGETKMYVTTPIHGCVASQKWTIDGNGYAVCNRGGKKMSLHRIIAEAKKGQIVDHINCNRIDNRHRNLRIVDRRGNAVNRRKSKQPMSSQYKGVSWDRSREKWKACIKDGAKSRTLGRFGDEKEAALAYDKASIELHGALARPNF